MVLEKPTLVPLGLNTTFWKAFQPPLSRRAVVAFQSRPVEPNKKDARRSNAVAFSLLATLLFLTGGLAGPALAQTDPAPSQPIFAPFPPQFRNGSDKLPFGVPCNWLPSDPISTAASFSSME